MLSKFCVFCGEKPDRKTKEHILPRWLIELTGKPNRSAFFGFRKDIQKGFEKRAYSFSQFTFPACGDCNSRYSALESATKAIFQRILEDKDVTAKDVSLLLDWLDKVRVGLWLGMNQLDANFMNIEPNFHIDKRIGQYDRLLIVEKSDGTSAKLNFGGVETPAFSFSPSAFVLIVNNFFFTNVSSMFLFARRLGFPFPKKSFVMPDSDKVEIEMVEGRERVMLPLLRRPILEKGTNVYQPMYPGGLIDGDLAEYYSNYTREHSIDDERGTGNIFIEDGGSLAEHGSASSLNLTPASTQNDEELFLRSAINILEWQNWLVSLMPSTERLSHGQRRYVKKKFRMAVEINDMFIEYHKRLLRTSAF